MSYDNSNTGTLNRTKEKFTDKSPDWYGTIKIEGALLEAALAGKPIRLAGWMRNGQYGEFISLKASLPKEMTSAGQQSAPASKTSPAWADEKNATPAKTERAAVPAEFEDDLEIPF